MTFTQLTVLHLIATAYMTGLIWFVQIVHYPLFAGVGDRAFRSYEERHTARTTWVVLPPMFAELGLAGWLALKAPAEAETITTAGLGMVIAIWLSTFTIQVPCHARLSAGFDRGAWRRLVLSNWIRTALWTGRCAIAAALLW
ncbi:MAG: hypothetical protein CMJ88_14515 [Planctomycetes bacterium]|nr:hypothetical protein [Planctomycetota bacterium]